MFFNIMMTNKVNRQVKPKIKELIISKLLIIFGIYSAVFFMIWLMDASFRQNNFLYVIIILSFAYKVTLLVIEWFLIWHPSIPDKPALKTDFTVDVLTTYVKGEPKDMVRNSLLAIKSITYPHETFLCDEADDPDLKEFCAEHNIHHVTREKKINAKAGNINNALQTVAKGDIVLILDPDHVVYPNFLDEVLPYFEDEKMGFVQVVQAYYNQYETIIAKAAAEQTYQFYGPAMMTLNSYGAVPAIGANCTFRRAALDSIGGHAPGLTEDMHTALRLKANGWKSVYDPVIVAKGLVPWNYSGYSLQQLKWSRGSFDLLFNVFPKVAKNLSWAERLAFLTVPLFYFSGIVALFDFLIPVFALLAGLIPINLHVFDFFIYYVPLFAISQIIRFYHQRWYFEEHEKGTAILGGILFKSTWWATMLGFIYSLIKRKVPYIPTPKDNRLETPWKLLIPNFSIIVLSSVAIVYGLIHDFTPFSLFMAFLALLNILILSFGNLMAMQKQIVFVHNLLKGSFITKNSSTRRFTFKVKHYAYNIFSKNYLVFGGLFFLVIFNIAISKVEFSRLPYFIVDTKIGQKALAIIGIKYSSTNEKNYGQLYYGINNEKGLRFYDSSVAFIKSEFYLNQDNKTSLTQFLDSCYSNNIIPFLSLSVDTSNVVFAGGDSNILTLKQIYNEIKYRYLPIVIMFDRNMKGVSPEVYDRMFKQSYFMADSMAINTIITWVWHSSNIDEDSRLIYYCNNRDNQNMIDWIFDDHEVATFSDSIYYGMERANITKPLLIKGSNVLRNKENKLNNSIYKRGNVVAILQPEHQHSGKLAYNLTQVFKRPEEKERDEVKVTKYVKGVVYNSGNGWNNNSTTLPLTVNKLRKDFELINEMGCNTIRISHESIYNYNILKTVKEFDLDVLYGFSLASTINYFNDTLKLEERKQEILKTVRKYKNNPSILAWELGNETWYFLNRLFGQPYLNVVRTSYFKFINELATEIKRIDPDRPVYTVENQISASMYSIAEYAPQIDFFGINSYYGSIDKLQEMAQRNLDGMPYLVTEYGNTGYWNTELNDFDVNHRILEPTSMQKANEYAISWNIIAADRKNNLGGVAFCWQDKYEYLATWYGIIDIFGNKKPAYNALKEAYSSLSEEELRNQFPISEFKIYARINNAIKNKVDVEAFSVKNVNSMKLQYKWIVYTDIVYTDHYFDKTKVFYKITESDFEYGRTDFSLTLPDDNVPYRIYLYVKDDLNNVITESLPLFRAGE
ncbi:glycosyltransferase [Saccharicrinis sp. FJH2]|uniref:glycosyltransferase n=1 Tax=Saccharicrinis sp. FJH65 TaxID=3344659 RepID=UPI0035F33DFA